jgi:hypothetical protein
MDAPKKVLAERAGEAREGGGQGFALIEVLDGANSQVVGYQ